MTKNNINKIRESLKRRNAKERRFKWLGRLAISMSLAFMAILLIDVFEKGYRSFYKTEINLNLIVPGVSSQDRQQDENLYSFDWDKLSQQSLNRLISTEATELQRRQILAMFSDAVSWQLRELAVLKAKEQTQIINAWVSASSPVDIRMKYGSTEANLTSYQEEVLQDWIARDVIRVSFNGDFFTAGVSRNPEQAGIGGALKGTALMLLVTLLLSFPLGVATAVYLEEFAPKNRWSRFVEVNINNLAAVPSVIFGLLGLAVFLQVFSMPRSAPLVGGLVLTLMTMPTIIIAARASIKAVPPSIRDAALALGASKTQVVFHHVLPFAMPGILTGSIIGMAQALGETAPLIMIGMVAFIVDVPEVVTDPSAALPVQIFLWSDAPERGFLEKTSGAILVLLMFLITMNSVAIALRRRLEKKSK